MLRSKIMILAMPVTILAAVAASAQQDDGTAPAPTGNAAHGKAIYIAVGCSECHGRRGQGGFAPTVADTAFDYTSFAFQVRNPVNTMPAYTEKVLSEKDLADIYAFTRSLPGPKPVKGFSMLEAKP